MYEPLINVLNVTFGYKQEPVLEAVNLAIFKDDYLAIIGPNGGGKTTLLKLILGLLRPWTGEIDFHFSSPHKKEVIGYVPQFSNFDRDFPLNVKDVVLMGKLKERGIWKRYSRQDHLDAEEALDRVNLLYSKDSHINELSGGQIQRVLIARAIVATPQILMLDEPTSSIDIGSKFILNDLLLDINKKIPVVVVSHDTTALATGIKQIACVNRHLHYHEDGKLTQEVIDETYGCPVDIISHGVAHRVLREHDKAHGHGCRHDGKKRENREKEK
ncbi:MAG: metal ABC transporter ATP-binding protein [bacterium]